ncbi:MAG: ABC transporter permease [Candidatus Pacearchaeota archaeon]
MIGKEIILYSLKNLLHRKARSFLTIFSILIGIATIFIFISFGIGLYSYINDLAAGSSVDKVIIQPIGLAAPGLDTTFQLTDKDLETIEKTAGVYEATGLYFKVAEVKQDGERVYTFLAATDPERDLLKEVYSVGIVKGRDLKKGDNGKVVLGYNYMLDDKIFSKGIELGQKIEVQGQKLEVVGFMEQIGTPQDDSQIYIVNNFVDELYPNEENTYGWIIARVDYKNIDLVTERIEKNLRKERDVEKGQEDFFVQSFQDMIDSYSFVLDIIIGFIILIALISVVVSAVNTTNTMVTSVLERTKEIGTMKAIGSKNSEIFKMFLFESAFLGFIAGTIGVILGFILSYTGGQILASLGWGFLKPAFPYYLWGGCILFATINGALSGALPAWNAAKTNISEALRYE